MGFNSKKNITKYNIHGYASINSNVHCKCKKTLKLKLRMVNGS